MAPLFVQPFGQLPHVLLPAVFVHTRLLSHPPLLVKHSFTSNHTCMGVRVVSNRYRHRLPVEWAWSRNFRTFTCEMNPVDQRVSIHKPLQPNAPSLAQPVGQSPHLWPPCVLIHLRLLSHPPLSPRHSSWSESTHRQAHTQVFQSVRIACDKKIREPTHRTIAYTPRQI